MKRYVAALVIILAATLAALWLTGKLGQSGRLSPEEIGQRIARQKAELKAELAAEGKDYEPDLLPNQWGYIQRAYPYQRINFEQLKEAVIQAQSMRLTAGKTFGPLSTDWVEKGPTNIGARVTDLAIHPTDPDVIYAAHASSGVFKTTDGGATCVPISDDLPVLSIGAIALDPQNPDVVYVGTGEANANSYSFFGMGMFKSTDGGATWNYIGLEETRYIARIVIDPKNTQRIWVAGTGTLYGTNPERGIYRSPDGGDTWQLVLAINDSTAATDIAIDPSRPDTVFAAMWERVRGLNYRRSGGPASGIYRSYNGGDSWVELTNGLPTDHTVGRIGISLCESDPSVVYALYSNHNGYFKGIYKSTDGGDSWTQTNTEDIIGFYSNYGWYFGQIRVDPGNPDRALALGINLYRTENGGDIWSAVGANMHVDHHALVFDPADPGRIFDGNDGGIYFSTNSGGMWAQQRGQHTNQFYAIEIDYLNPQRLYGGTQDNGTLRTPTGAVDDWEMILGGDGFYCIVDPTNSDRIYAEYQYGNLYRSENFGERWKGVLEGIDEDDRRNWMTPVVLDPSDPQTLYYGTYRVYKSTNRGDSWVAVSPDLTNGNQGAGFGTITTIAVAPADPDIIYAGTDDSNVWRTLNGGSLWTKISDSLPNRWVTRVAVDPTDGNIAYVTFSGLRWDEQVGHVYRTVDAGFSWTDITEDLPGAPVNAIVVDPGQPSRLFVGTDVGCYYTDHPGDTWQMLGSAMPPVPVYDLKLHHPSRTLVAGTHGRSMYSFDLTGLPDLSGITAPAPEVVTKLSSHPNPFSLSTTIAFTLSRPSDVSLIVYDMTGRKVRTLKRGSLGAGSHRAAWDGSNDAGRPVASGIYFVRLETESGAVSRTLSLVK